MNPVAISAYTLTCALGIGMTAVRNSIEAQRGGLDDQPWPESNVATWLGRVSELDKNPAALPTMHDSRNNRLAKRALQQDDFQLRVSEAIERYGAHRCAVMLGTSTSSIGRTEASYRRLEQGDHFNPDDRYASLHNPHSTGAFVAAHLDIKGPAVTISTACSSSARAFASAARWLECGIADAVVVGGVDTLCLSVICGFNSLQLTSTEPCRPFDKNRAGLSLGEAGGFALLTREILAGDDNVVALLGYGESLDAYHMSSAHPEGLGAKLAMQAAVQRANVAWDDIHYLNLHGTGTRSNDAIEGLACNALLPATTLCSSTKSWTGHTLGAAGITEAVISMDALLTGLVPGTLHTQDPDPDTMLDILIENRASNPQTVMSNSFGFGGNNCCLVFGKSP